MLSPDNDQQKVSSVVHPHHVIRVTELLEQSLIQSLLLTHHCYSLPCVCILTFTTVIKSQHGLRLITVTGIWICIILNCIFLHWIRIQIALNHFIWKRLKVIVGLCGRLPLSRNANTWLDHDDVSIGPYCALLALQWEANLSSTYVQVMNTWPLWYSITRLESQNRKFAPILIITGPKNDNLFVCKQTGFVNQRLWDFTKMSVIRVILWKTWLESSHHLSQRNLSLVRVTKNRDSSRVIDMSHAITARRAGQMLPQYQESILEYNAV